MQNFSQIVTEGRERKNFNSEALLSSEISSYMRKINKSLPKPVQDVLYLTQKYNILDEGVLRQIMDASKNELSKLAGTTNVSEENLLDLQKQLKSLKSNIRLLPQFQTKAEREAIEAGQLAMDDLTIDLESQVGRNAAAKVYTQLVYKIANQLQGKSSLDRAALISAGLAGLAEAINDFDRSKTDKPFKMYASYRIYQSMMDDINSYSHSLSGTNWYSNSSEKYKEVIDALRIDDFHPGDDDSDRADDRQAWLGVEDDHKHLDIHKSEEEYWQEVYKALEAKFSTRDCNIFYRYFGLKEFYGKKEKSKDIAKSYGMSEGNIRNSVINKMLNYLKTNNKTKGILADLRRIYNESLMKDLVYLSNKQDIYEALVGDDMFILLEELNRWSNKNVFKTTVLNTLNNFNVEDSKYLIDCIENGFEFIDDSYRKHKNIIVAFLKALYPTESFARQSDVTIIDRMVELSDVSKDHKIKW